MKINDFHENSRKLSSNIHVCRSVSALARLHGGGMLFGRRAQEVEPPAAPGGSREGRRAPLAARPRRRHFE